ncbi:hypothetical protein E6R60_26550 [Streptomyces sp. A0642]|uniref:hypothetical protein n=1 Tax=Streptomyces sp. A0642 TaxID=2563100 RepID=UPI0010A28E62|nr:hypothetical protein [Streptomyces sp. A0642]THA72494.1 hypothetical protein E6R60_26550 [Streptomyces sp. A0642]
MDPVTLEQLFYELRSPNAATVEITADDLTPGCVIATSEWTRHVVTALPNLLSARTLSVPVRHLHGGHTVTRRFRRSATVTVYAATLAARYVRDVPEVPRCFVPDDPEVGDRVYHDMHDALTLGTNRYFEYDGSQWRSIVTTASRDGRRARDIVTYYDGIHHLVGSDSQSSPYGYFTYQHAGHGRYLYVDGRPMPARRADELVVGDELRLPGGGRLTVRRIVSTGDGIALSLELTGRSVHTLRHVTWASGLGEMIEHHDSGRTGALYATQPRPSELLTAAELLSGDTVITSWGTRASAVATVCDVWRQPVRAVMHLHCIADDGRMLRVQGYIEPRHLLLCRPQRPAVLATA